MDYAFYLLLDAAIVFYAFYLLRVTRFTYF